MVFQHESGANYDVGFLTDPGWVVGWCKSHEDAGCGNLVFGFAGSLLKGGAPCRRRMQVAGLQVEGVVLLRSGLVPLSDAGRELRAGNGKVILPVFGLTRTESREDLGAGKMNTE